MRKLLLMDTETGGNNPSRFSLLTVYAAIVDPVSLLIYQENHWKLKPDDGIYRVSGGGLEANQINLVEHDKTALFPTKGSRRWNIEFENFLWTCGGSYQVLGHNVHFDIEAITSAIGPSWQERISRRYLDTAAIALYLQNCGFLLANSEEEISLKKLASHFNLSHGTLHDAKTDALLTLEVYRKMRDLIKTAPTITKETKQHEILR